MFKKMMLIGGAAVLLAGSAWAADAPETTAADSTTQPTNAISIFSTNPDPQDLRAKQELTSAELQKMELMRADLEAKIKGMTINGYGPGNPDLSAARMKLAQMDREQADMSKNAASLMARAQQQERILPLLKQRDQLQLQLGEASAQMGPKSPTIQALQSRLQMLDVQLASMGEPMKTSVKIIEGTLLGVSTTSVSEDVAQQLKLQSGFGLTVRSIVPASPAESAGVKKYDVLTKLDDQLLITPVQLQTLIESHKAGDEITLTYIHAGQSTTATTRLSTGLSMQMPDMEMPAMILRPAPFKVTVPSIHSVVTKTVGNAQLVLSDHHLVIDQMTPRKNIFNGQIETPEQRNAVPVEYQQAVTELLNREDAMASTTQPDNVFLGEGKIMLSNDGSTINADRLTINNRRILPDTQRQLLLWTGKSHTLILTLSDGEPAHLLAKDQQGNKVFDGPVQTLDDQSKIPAELQEEYQYLVQHPQAGDDLMKQQ
jgi:hypothetical protein